MKRNWKAGVCAALCSAMVFTGIGPVLTPYLENAVVYADENEKFRGKKSFYCRIS
mgnify:CR=1 FL=1